MPIIINKRVVALNLPLLSDFQGGRTVMRFDDNYDYFSITDETLQAGLAMVKRRVELIWAKPLIRYFTEHGIRHSENIIRIMGKLLENCVQLTDHEAFILIAAAYTHDIGMQQNRAEELENGKILRDMDEFDIIRQRHHDLSFQMILDSVSGQNICSSLGLENFKDYVDNIAVVAKYHRRYDLSELEDDSFKGETVRLPLLASLLRLGDELDCDCGRVNLELLKIDNIPVESKFHWWCCAYVKSVHIESGKIKLFFRFPKNSRNVSTIQIIKDHVESSISQQMEEVYDVLDRYGIRLYKGVVSELSFSPLAPDIPADLCEYLNNETVCSNVYTAASKVLVSLEKNTFAPLFASYKEMDIRFNDKDVDEIVNDILCKRFILLVGESGVGKTYTLLRVMRRCIDSRKFIPVFLSSGVFSNKSFAELSDFVKNAYQQISSREATILAESAREPEKCLFLIDALNEVPFSVQKGILKWVETMLEQGGNVIVSTQKLPLEMMDVRLNNKMNIMEVSSKSIHRELMSFAHDYLKNKDEKIKKLDYIDKIDNTLIGILVIYYVDKNDSMNIRLTQIFSHVINQILEFRKKRCVDFDNTFAMELLLDVVYWHYVNECGFMTSSILKWVTQNRNLQNSVFPNDRSFLYWICNESIFNRQDGDNLSLIHEKLGDYLIACKIYRLLSYGSYQDLIEQKVFQRDVTIRISSFLTDFLSDHVNSAHIIGNLKALYLGSCPGTEKPSIILRQQTAFYLGIMEELSLNNKIVQDCKVVQRAFIVGQAISGENMDRFLSYCHSLPVDQREEQINLCYTLIHQGDYKTYTEETFECFPVNEVECENALKGMLRQLLKKEYSNIDILAIITVNDYYTLFRTQINEILSLWYNWNHSIKSQLQNHIQSLYQIFRDDPILISEIQTFEDTFLT